MPDHQQPVNPVLAQAYLEQAAYFLGRPLAMAPQSFRAMAGTLTMMVNGGGLEANAFAGTFDGENRFSTTRQGTAIVPIHGTLIDRGAWMGNHCGNTSYEGLNEQFKRLAKDDGIKRVVLDINSGGGMVAGIWDVFPGLDALKVKKPVIAIAQNFAASAAYAIASAAHEVVITRAGHVGSVGVIAQHMSVEKMMERIGLDVTLIMAGARKGDGNPYESLPDNVKEDWQARVEKSDRQFVSHVSKYRDMDTEAVRETEAGLFEGQEAVDVGFADRVMGFDEMLEDFEQRTGQTVGANRRGRKMSDENDSNIGAVSVPQIAAFGAPVLDGAAIRADERQKTMSRAGAILGSEEAVGRESYARELAFDADLAALSAEKIISSMLAKAPKEQVDMEPVQNKASSFSDALSAQMAKHGNSPNLGADSDVNDEGSGPSFVDNLKSSNVFELKGASK